MDVRVCTSVPAQEGERVPGLHKDTGMHRWALLSFVVRIRGGAVHCLVADLMT